LGLSLVLVGFVEFVEVWPVGYFVDLVDSAVWVVGLGSVGLGSVGLGSVGLGSVVVVVVGCFANCGHFVGTEQVDRFVVDFAVRFRPCFSSSLGPLVDLGFERIDHLPEGVDQGEQGLVEQGQLVEQREHVEQRVVVAGEQLRYWPELLVVVEIDFDFEH